MIVPVARTHFADLSTLFRESIEDTCQKNHIFDRSIVEAEVAEKISKLERYLHCPVDGEAMLCVLAQGRPVAVGGYFPCAGDILAHGDATTADVEIGSLYVAPLSQGRGIGRLVFEELKGQIRATGRHQAFLDSGYPSSQSYWRKQLGEPHRDTESPFGPAFRYQIWRVEL